MTASQEPLNSRKRHEALPYPALFSLTLNAGGGNALQSLYPCVQSETLGRCVNPHSSSLLPHPPPSHVITLISNLAFPQFPNSNKHPLETKRRLAEKARRLTFSSSPALNPKMNQEKTPKDNKNSARIIFALFFLSQYLIRFR